MPEHVERVRRRSASIGFRIRVVWMGMIVAFFFLGTVLWRMQVASGEHYRQRLMRQSTRRVRLPARRGRIFDCRGAILADNRPSYCIAIHFEELRQRGPWSRTVEYVDSLLDRLADMLGLPRRISREDIRMHIRRRLPLPLIAWRDLDDVALARWAELASNIPGVELYVDSVRCYPFGPLFCHVVGYVGRAAVTPSGRDFDYYLPEYEGRRGVEKTYDSLLRGKAGGKVVLVDASGFRYRDLVSRPAKDGADLWLTLDVRIQQAAFDALGDRAGAVVVLGPQDGRILALVSSPGFDPNMFVPAISPADWNALLEDSRRPLLNRAIAGAYVPGSTIKPLVAMAALSTGAAGRDTEFTCPGYLDLGGRRFHCWYRKGHGRLNMVAALRYSCNVYFYRLALRCGPEPIWRLAREVGLGRRTGVDLDYELSGLVPDREWHRRHFGRGWSDGDTCNLAIGQGAIVVTPLQMAVVAAAFANGGRMVRPHVADRIIRNGVSKFLGRGPETADLGWRPQDVEVVLEGMAEVVGARDGTGRRAALPGYRIAGKTGTAQYGPEDDRKKYCWMIAFAPLEKPRYAISVVLDEGQSGGQDAAPIVREVLKRCFEAEACE
ncbi:MAG: penicillin-binding protein 2 [Verrucomicrobia bacterium]|nr:MAG: penicillin-binding protein 2 [Verrucomicrobiota bacterium]